MSSPFLNAGNPIRKTCAIVALHNGERYIRRCLEYLLGDPMVTEVLVLDNLSSDRGPEICREYPISLFKLNKNYGFGKANNLGMYLACQQGFDYVYLVNQDVYIRDDAVTVLVEHHQSQRGTDMVLCSLQLDGSFSKVDHNFGMYLRAACGKDAPSCNDLKNFPEKEVLKAYFFNAAAWLLPVPLIQKVGLFDPLFPHYREDEDFAARCKWHGIDFYAHFGSVVAHDRDQSGFKRLENRKFHDQVNRIHVRQIKVLKNINIPLLTCLRITLRFMAARLWFVCKSADFKHLLALLKASGKTAVVFPQVLRNRSASRGAGAFWKQTAELLRLQENGPERWNWIREYDPMHRFGP